jgi:hypothetical protein
MDERQQRARRVWEASPLPQVEKAPHLDAVRRGATRRIGGYYAPVVSRYFAAERCQVSKRLVAWPKGPLVGPKGQLVSPV